MNASDFSIAEHFNVYSPKSGVNVRKIDQSAGCLLLKVKVILVFH